jgi:hypothetical protein
VRVRVAASSCRWFATVSGRTVRAPLDEELQECLCWLCRFTALHYASSNGHTATAMALVTAGADVHCKANHGCGFSGCIGTARFVRHWERKLGDGGDEARRGHTILNEMASGCVCVHLACARRGGWFSGSEPMLYAQRGTTNFGRSCRSDYLIGAKLRGVPVWAVQAYAAARCVDEGPHGDGTGAGGGGCGRALQGQ